MRSRVLLLIFSLCFTGSVSAQNFDPKRIYQKTSNAVVLVAAFERGGKYTSSGTGSIINEDGLILTNAHVIFNSDRNKTFEELLIFLKPDKVTGNLKKDTSRKFKASLVRYSNQLDLALLKIDKNNAINKLPFLELSNLQKISIGDPVIAIGHPEQGGLWTLTTGTISSLIESYGNIPGKDVFQTETSINKGNSGGPLIDKYGSIVGVNSMIARKGSNNTAITDINFSIQSTVAVKWMNSVGQSLS
ncbi:MAG: trypsin-like serine protease, partial [Nitrospina sp.]|nr:trypsin-like serine protease [Nitrospina sp.]